MVNRHSLIFKLHNLDLSTKVVKSWGTLVEYCEVCLSHGGGERHIFFMHVGVKQDCLLSPILFSLCISDIEEYLDGGGVLIGSRKVKILARADDLVFLASVVQSLLRIINSLVGYVFRSLKFENWYWQISEWGSNSNSNNNNNQSRIWFKEHIFYLRNSFKSPRPIYSNSRHIGFPTAQTPKSLTIFGWSNSANRQASLSKSSWRSSDASSLSILTATRVNSSPFSSPGAFAYK